MKHTLHKILIGLTVLLLFPVAIATFYEYIRINDNEKLISTVYQDQLETIVSSINGYAQDVAGNWASRIDLWLLYPSDNAPLERLSNENPSIKGIYTSAADHSVQTLYKPSNQGDKSSVINAIRTKEEEQIKQLLTYYENNYRKFLSHPLEENVYFLFFVSRDRNHNPVVCYIELDLRLFLQNQDQKLVFDKFFRVTNQNQANEVKGTGLGLSIVQKIVKAHKGKITLHSKIGAGATFRLYFPILHKPKARTNDSYTDC